MNQHFTNFTAESMAAFRQAIEDGKQSRSDALWMLRESTKELLDNARRDRAEAEGDRKSHAAHDASSRQTFMNALRMQVGAMKGDFRAKREEMSEDLRAMASELRAAQDAFRGNSQNHGNNRRGAAR